MTFNRPNTDAWDKHEFFEYTRRFRKSFLKPITRYKLTKKEKAVLMDVLDCINTIDIRLAREKLTKSLRREIVKLMDQAELDATIAFFSLLERQAQLKS